MRSLIASALILAAGPALATGLEIDVEGEGSGTVVIDLLEDVAPNHVEQITALAEAGAYDGVVFHRVIPGFMAQTGDVQHGRVGGNLALAGTGSSDRPNVDAEFSDVSFERGVVGMARSSDPDSANAQFFIMFAPATHLDGEYTVIGRVTEGMDVIDGVKKGSVERNGAIEGAPDVMSDVRVVP